MPSFKQPLRSGHGPLTRYTKLRVAHAPGMPGTDFKANRQLAIPTCITARVSHTCRDAYRDRRFSKWKYLASSFAGAHLLQGNWPLFGTLPVVGIRRILSALGSWLWSVKMWSVLSALLITILTAMECIIYAFRTMTTSNGNIFSVTGHWVNNREAGDLKRHRAQYAVIVMVCYRKAHLIGWARYVLSIQHIMLLHI